VRGVLLDQLEQGVNLVLKDSVVLQDNLAPRVCLENVVPLDWLDLLDLLVHLEREDQLGLLANLDSLALKGSEDNLDLRVLLESEDHLV
jgi:hypothetical protein